MAWQCCWQVVGQLRRLGRVTHKSKGLAPAMASTEFQEEAGGQLPVPALGGNRPAWRAGRQLTAGGWDLQSPSHVLDTVGNSGDGNGHEKAEYPLKLLLGVSLQAALCHCSVQQKK